MKRETGKDDVMCQIFEQLNAGVQDRILRSAKCLLKAQNAMRAGPPGKAKRQAGGKGD
jgi:hypothetical protein